MADSGGKLSMMAKAQARAGTGKKKKSGTEDAAQTKKKVGRPRAKHSDPDYKQMSIYIHKDVRNKVKARLFEQDGEFSALVESLLRDWLNKLATGKRR